MNPEARVFDLVLVYTSFRRHDPYLNIAKHLGRDLRIGILKLDADLTKTERTESQFLSECLEAGAVLINGPVQCRALMIPRMGIGSIEKLAGRVAQGLRYEKLLIFVNGAFTGVPFLAEIHRRFGRGTILSQELKRFAAYEPETKDFLRTTPLEIVEVGSPYRVYPAVNGFETDYLVAYPSHNSLAHRNHTYPLLDRLMRVLDDLPRDARVMIKPHNVKDAGNYISYRSRTLENLRLPGWLLKLPLLAFRAIAWLPLGGVPLYMRLPTRFADMLRHLQNEYIFGRCENVLDRFPGYGMEHFIRGVRKGVITGLSTVIWEALYQKKPIFNLDVLPLDARLVNFQILARSCRIQEYQGFSELGFGTIDESSRERDLLGYLREQCSATAAAQ